jgi:hypothetical protein
MKQTKRARLISATRRDINSRAGDTRTFPSDSCWKRKSEENLIVISSAWRRGRKPSFLKIIQKLGVRSLLGAFEEAAGIHHHPSCWRESSWPSARRRVMMRSESTSALGQPSETKLIFGAGARSAAGAGAGFRAVSVGMGAGASRNRWRYQRIWCIFLCLDIVCMPAFEPGADISIQRSARLFRPGCISSRPLAAAPRILPSA